MSERNDGGPAFPSSNDVRVGDIGTSGHRGMSLRDYFAAKALVGLCTRDFHHNEEKRPFVEWASAIAYELADDMLKEREK